MYVPIGKEREREARKEMLINTSKDLRGSHTSSLCP